MAWFRVVHEDGSVEKVEAESKSEASRKVRSPGEKIQEVTEITEGIPVTPTYPTPTPTTPTPTPAPTISSVAGDIERAQTVKERLDQQVREYNAAHGTNYDFNEYLDALTQITPHTRDVLRQQYADAESQLEEYNAYLEFLNTPQGADFPKPEDIYDYYANKDIWMQQYITPPPLPGIEPPPIPPEDIYALTPEERARRREEAYGEARYAAEERYREPARYPETFAAWIERQGDVSQALKGYIERQYPSLRAEYEAGIPRPTGFPTREEARVEAERRERGFEAWLTEERPEIREEYYMQRPRAREERLWIQAPTLRAVAW